MSATSTPATRPPRPTGIGSPSRGCAPSSRPGTPKTWRGGSRMSSAPSRRRSACSRRVWFPPCPRSWPLAPEARASVWWRGSILATAAPGQSRASSPPTGASATERGSMTRSHQPAGRIPARPYFADLGGGVSCLVPVARLCRREQARSPRLRSPRTRAGRPGSRLRTAPRAWRPWPWAGTSSSTSIPTSTSSRPTGPRPCVRP